MNELALFAGAGGGILGGSLLGWRTVCAVESATYPRRVILARQRDGILPRFPIWDDVRTFDGKPWRGRVDVITGGFPCQDISAAGKGSGIDGERSGLWGQMARIVGEVRPRYVFVENSPLLVGRGLARVLADLTEMGFDVRWGIVGASDVGAPHRRERCWVVADAEIQRLQGGNIARRNAQGSNQGLFAEPTRSCCGVGAEWWSVEPGMGRVVNGLAARVDRLKAIGNGQVPAVAAAAWRILIENK